jgi:hypothetical protein
MALLLDSGTAWPWRAQFSRESDKTGLTAHLVGHEHNRHSLMATISRSTTLATDSIVATDASEVSGKQQLAQ